MYQYIIDKVATTEKDFFDKLQLALQDDLMDKFNELLDQREFEFENVKMPYHKAWQLLDEESYWIAFKTFRTKEIINLALDMQKYGNKIEVDWNIYQIRRFNNVSH